MVPLDYMKPNYQRGLELVHQAAQEVGAKAHGLNFLLDIQGGVVRAISCSIIRPLTREEIDYLQTTVQRVVGSVCKHEGIELHLEPPTAIAYKV